MSRISIALLFVLGMASCVKQEVPADLSALNNEIQEANEVIGKLDSAAVMTDFNKVKPYYLHLSSTDFDSTLKDVYVYDLTWLDRYQRAIAKWNLQERLNRVKLEESTDRVARLIHDVENGLLDSAEIRIYTQQERLEIQSIIDKTKTRGGEILYYGNGVDSMFTRLDSIFPELQ